MPFVHLLAVVCASLLLAGCYGGEAIRLDIYSTTRRVVSPAATRAAGASSVAEQVQAFAIVRQVALEYGLTAQPHEGIEPFADATYCVEVSGALRTSRTSPTVVVTSTRGDIIAIASMLASPGRELEFGERIAAELKRRLEMRFGIGRVRVRRESLTNAF